MFQRKKLISSVSVRIFTVIFDDIPKTSFFFLKSQFFRSVGNVIQQIKKVSSNLCCDTRHYLSYFFSKCFSSKCHLSSCKHAYKYTRTNVCGATHMQKISFDMKEKGSYYCFIYTENETFVKQWVGSVDIFIKVHKCKDVFT